MSTDQAKHSARVYLTEARNRRGSPFFWVLLRWAANARRRAMKPAEALPPEVSPPAQMELFA